MIKSKLRCFISCLTICLSIFEAVSQSEEADLWQPEGLVLLEPGASRMNILVSPLKEKATYLVDAYGSVLREWESEYVPGLSAYLTPDGGLIRAGKIEDGVPDRFKSGGGRGGIIERFGKDGERVWRFEYASNEAMLHHDFKLLPNGNVMAIAWAAVGLDAAASAGRKKEGLFGDSIWYLRVIEIEPRRSEGGHIVWQWDAWDHLIQDADTEKENFGDVAKSPEKIDVNYYRLPVARKPIPQGSNPKTKIAAVKGAGIGRMDWMHANSIDYDEESGLILLSIHGFDEIWVIDRNDPDAGLKYRFGNPKPVRLDPEIPVFFYRQHDAQWVRSPEGELRILVFNNGLANSYHHYSSIVELELPWSGGSGFRKSASGSYAPPKIAWRFDGKDEESRRLFANRMSGTQRLSNGNTIFCNGPKGRVLEVDPAGNTVWEYWNPFGELGPESDNPRHASSTRPVFKIRMYEPE